MTSTHSVEDTYFGVESALLGVEGDLLAVEEELRKIINDPNVETLCRNLGIRSAGFLFVDVHFGLIRFLQDDVQYDTDAGAEFLDGVRTPYYWREKDNEKLDEIVPALFSIVRRRQAREDVSWSDSESLLCLNTEYVLHLPSKSGNSNYNETARRLEIHYCSIGELWLTLLLWRLLGTARDLGLASQPLASLNQSLLDMPIACKALEWRGVPLLSLALAHESAGLQPFADAWETRFCPGQTWREELDLIGGSDLAWRFECAAKYACDLGFHSKLGSASLSAQQVNALLVTSGPGLLNSLGIEHEGVPISQLLDSLERRARFPILPFFTWNIAERSPVTFMVCPVWTSQQYPLRVGQQLCRHLGLALCAVDPIAGLDMFLADTMKGDVSAPLPATLVSLLKLIARPLVEGSLYAPAVRNAKVKSKDRKRLRGVEKELVESVGDGFASSQSGRLRPVDANPYDRS
jgi:hypothetical protein